MPKSQSLRVYKGRTIVTAHQEDHANQMQLEGADLVLMPFNDAAEVVCDRLHSLE